MSERTDAIRRGQERAQAEVEAKLRRLPWSLRVVVMGGGGFIWQTVLSAKYEREELRKIGRRW